MSTHNTVLLPLLRLKIRLILNSFINWKSAGKIAAAFFVIVVTSHAMASGAFDLVNTFAMMPFGIFILEWVLALICLYLMALVFTGDMLTGHSLNAGQMSADFAYLTTLPVPPLSLIIVKLFERMLTDYIGLLILLTGIFGIVFRDGFSVYGLLLGLTIYLQISMLIGLGINLLTIAMRRFFRQAAINNIFSLLGYISVFLTFFPYLILTSFPARSLSWLIEYSDSFSSPLFKVVLPFRWLSRTLLATGSDREFLYWSLFWLILVIAGCLIFYLMIGLNWLTFSHSAARRKKQTGRRIFRGFFQKELLLLKSDFNMLINAILMPISIIVLEIYFLKNVINLASASQLLSLIYAAVVYFCMFGPINSVGAEGKSIAIIESLPMSGAHFVFRKFFFWLVIAEAIFIPTSYTAFRYLNYISSTALESTLLIATFTAVCVWISVHISCIFPNFESKVLQQKSTITGKASGLLLMLLAVPIKGFDLLSLLNIAVLIVALLLIRQITLETFKNRLDPDHQPLAPNRIQPYILLLIIFSGTEIAIRQFFLAIIPGQDTGIWTWLIASLMFYSISLLFVGNSLKHDSIQIKQNLFCPPHITKVVLAFLLSVTLLLSFCNMVNESTHLDLSVNLRSVLALENLQPLSSTPEAETLLSRAITLAGQNYWFAFALILMTLCTIVFSTCFIGMLATCNNLKALALSLTGAAAVAPAGLTIHFVLLWGIAAAVFYRTRSLPLIWLISIPSVIGIFLTVLFL